MKSPDPSNSSDLGYHKNWSGSEKIDDVLIFIYFLGAFDEVTDENILQYAPETEATSAEVNQFQHFGAMYANFLIWLIRFFDAEVY